MITLIYARDAQQGFPFARCSEHGTVVAPKPAETPGKLTVVWVCEMCEAESKTNSPSRER